MGEYLLWNFDKKLALFVLRRLEQRDRNCVRLRASPQLFGWSPVGAPFVERVENDVVTLRVIEALGELQRRVVDDGRIAPASNLPEDLHDECRLACAGVRNDLYVLRLGLGRDPKHLR